LGVLGHFECKDNQNEKEGAADGSHSRAEKSILTLLESKDGKEGLAG
jgi:hypothetical protein